MHADPGPHLNNNILPTPEDAFVRASNRDSALLRTLRKSRVLFYPGAGADISPALRFAGIGAIDTVLYCDYIECVPQRVLEDFERLGRHYGLEARDVHASELGQRCRADLFPSNRNRWGRRDDDESNAVIGRVIEMRSCGSDQGTLTFIYLDTEAIQTYIHVWGVAGRAPLIVVVQDHGKGGAWTRLGGDCLMYTAAPVLPQFLWVGSEPWPNYSKISRPEVDEQSLHSNERALWECTRPDRINSDSPLKFLVSDEQNAVDPNRAAQLQPFRMPAEVRHRAGIPAQSHHKADG